MKKALGLLFLLTACHHEVWVKAGSTSDDFKYDNEFCMQIATNPVYNKLTSVDALYEGCMRSHGWHQEDRE